MKRLFLLVLAILTFVGGAPAHATERTYTLRDGPIRVTGFEIRHPGGHRVPHPKIDGFVTAMHARVVDRQGRPVPVHRVMLHHVVFHNFGRFAGEHQTTCNKHAEPFYGTGEENQELRFPPGYGYRMRPRDRWSTGWMLMNHTRADETVYLEYRVTVETAKLVPVRPFWVRVVGCLSADPIFNVPGGGAPGAIFAKARSWTVPESGRLIAGGGHVHGGARNLVLSQPRCGNRALFASQPLYGLPHDPVYHVFPVRHEPGPVSMSWIMSASGLPVVKGEQLRLSANYDDQYPHTRVMGIMHVYLARDADVTRACAPQPSDIQALQPAIPGRPDPPPFDVPLTALDSHGTPYTITQTPGRLRVAGGSATVDLKDLSFTKPNLSVPAGAAVRWRSRDRVDHNVTVASGPRGFASFDFGFGHSFSRRLTVPGVYSLYCTWHQFTMHQVVTVRP